MSIFVNSLKTFKSDITGEEREYKINNAVWVHLKADYGLGQSEWAEKVTEEDSIYGVKFVASVMKANGLEVTEEEVLENTNNTDIGKFIIAYQTAMMNRIEDVEETADDGEEKK